MWGVTVRWDTWTRCECSATDPKAWNVFSRTNSSVSNDFRPVEDNCVNTSRATCPHTTNSNRENHIISSPTWICWHGKHEAGIPMTSQPEEETLRLLRSSCCKVFPGFFSRTTWCETRRQERTREDQRRETTSGRGGKGKGTKRKAPERKRGRC